MKKFAAVLLSVLIMLSVVPITAFAANGPSEEKWGDDYFAFISIYDGEETRYRVFSNNETHNDLIEGAVYDRETNTLTLTDFKHPELKLSTNMMGDDFKLEIKGECQLSQIYVWGDYWGGSLDIQGDGTLTVNADRSVGTALIMPAEGSNAKLNFGKNVSVNLYAQEDSEAVAMISYSAYSDTDTGITFENGKSYPFSGGKAVEKDYEYVNIIEIEKGEYFRNFGYKVVCESDSDAIYVVSINEEGNQYWLYKFYYLEEYDALVEDPDFNQRAMTKEEFENSEYSVVMENQPVYLYYSNEENDKYRGDYTTKLLKASEPDEMYVVNFAWIDDREHPTDYFIHHLIWNEDLEFYVDDPDFDSLDLGPEEFAESEYEIVYDEDDNPVTLRYIDLDYYKFEEYADKAPKVVNDSKPGEIYIADDWYYESNNSGDPDGYYIKRVVYNEKKGGYYEDEVVEDITAEEFESKGYRFEYADQPVEFEFKSTGNVDFYSLPVYTDGEGSRYAVMYRSGVYDFSEDNTVTVLGKKYYVPTKNTEVNFSDLTPTEVEYELDVYNYAIKGTEFRYEGIGSEPEPVEALVGDVNGDGEVTVLDATDIQKYLVNLIDFNEAQKAAADVNADGDVTVDDATTIQKYLANMIDKLG